MKKSKINKNENGFTLLEIMMVVSLMGLIFAITIPIFYSFHKSNSLDIAASSFANALRKAQIYSMASNEDSQWGVHLEDGQLTLFKGTDFAGREAAFDEVTEFSENIDITGNTDYVFSKIYGIPQTTGRTTFDYQKTVTVEINNMGTIDY